MMHGAYNVKLWFMSDTRGIEGYERIKGGFKLSHCVSICCEMCFRVTSLLNILAQVGCWEEKRCHPGLSELKRILFC